MEHPALQKLYDEIMVTIKHPNLPDIVKSVFLENMFPLVKILDENMESPLSVEITENLHRLRPCNEQLLTQSDPSVSCASASSQ